MAEPKKTAPELGNTTFADRRAAREAAEAAGTAPAPAAPRTFRAGLDVEQPTITVVRR